MRLPLNRLIALLIPKFRLALAGGSLLTGALLGGSAVAQPPVAQPPVAPPAAGQPPVVRPPVAAPAVAAPAVAAPALKIVEPEKVVLPTRDGVQLEATYFASPLGKNAVPVILLHGYKGSRSDMESLALYLQREHRHAVIVPDLRGHGKSTKAGNRDIDAALLKPADFKAMVDFDIETVKNFLLEKNNSAELNIEKLCVVGAEMGATMAEIWAQKDWSWQQLPNYKQGRDVKALVLISPEMAFRGIPLKGPLASKELQSVLSTLIIVGSQNTKALADAKRINDQLQRFHAIPPEGQEEEKQTLYFAPLETSLQGVKVLKEPSLRVAEMIAAFIDRRLVKQTLPWTDRKSPL